MHCRNTKTFDTTFFFFFAWPDAADVSYWTSTRRRHFQRSSTQLPAPVDGTPGRCHHVPSFLCLSSFLCMCIALLLVVLTVSSPPAHSPFLLPPGRLCFTPIPELPATLYVFLGGGETQKDVCCFFRESQPSVTRLAALHMASHLQFKRHTYSSCPGQGSTVVALQRSQRSLRNFRFSNSNFLHSHSVRYSDIGGTRAGVKHVKSKPPSKLSFIFLLFPVACFPKSPYQKQGTWVALPQNERKERKKKARAVLARLNSQPEISTAKLLVTLSPRCCGNSFPIPPLPPLWVKI